MSLVSAELSATCNALGYYDERTKKYYADENTLETVKDLIRYLRRDDENHDIRRQLGESKVLEADLLPLLKSYWEQTELFDVLLRLLVNLTTPPLILWNEEIPTDKNVRNYYMQIEDHLQSYKLSFADDGLWSVLSSRLSTILEKDQSERTDETSLIIERILVLIRNILYVPADRTLERRPDNDANTHDQVLWAMHQSGILDILLYVSSSENETTYHMHVLEILSHLLKEQNPTELGKTELHRNHAEKVKDEAELLAMRHKEAIKKQQKAKIYSGARHSRFGGTFVVKSMKSISDNDLIYHKPLSRLDALSFDADKQKPRTPRNRLPVHLETTERRSAFSIRLFLKEFCVEFLNGAYNTLMYHVKDQLVRAKSHTHDASYYLWAIRFFMEFNRAYKFEVKLVSETVSVQTFHYVQQQMETFFDMIQSDKKKLRAWSRRLHIALLAYRELLMTLCFMDKSPDGTVRDSSKVIKSNIFYVLEYRELVLTLLLTYDELKMSDQYLKDLIETQHIFLRSFEAFCKDGAVMVQTRNKSKKKRKKKSGPAQEVPPEVSLEIKWDEASQYVATVLESGNIPTDVVPFDATSDVPIDEQKSETMIKIQKQLRSGEYENAIGLLRAARDVWPENDCFGSRGMSPEEEFTALKDIFLADLGENDLPVQPQPVFDENDEEEDEEEEGAINFSESDLKFEDFRKRLGHPKIVRATALALAMFEENSVNTNHCIVKLMHRIAFDCKMHAMMFQVSLFMTFKRILALKDMPEYKELVKFVTYILRQFFKLARTNSKIFMETLFWKSSKEAYDLEYGYGSHQEKANSNVRVWTEEDEDEVRRLFMEHKEKQLEEDVVDWVLENLIDNTRSRRALLKKMKELYLLTDYKKGKVRNTSKVPKQWSSEEEEKLAELFEQFKDAMDPLTCIMDRLEVARSKNRIVEKLLVLGLIQDRKEVRKKRAKGVSRPRSGKRNVESDRSDGSSGSDRDSQSDVDDVGRSVASSSNLPRRGEVVGKKKPKRSVAVNVSSKRLSEMTLGVLQSGMNEALDWLKESISDAIEDFEDDTDEGVPLVPIMDYSVTAMENADFQNMLQAMGISKPLNEQETYWRIPSTLPLNTLKTLLDILTKALEGNLTIPEEDATIVVGQRELSESERNEEKVAINNAPNTRENVQRDSEESEDEDVFEQIRKSNNQVLEQPSTSSKPDNKRRRMSSSDEDSDRVTTIRKKKKISTNLEDPENDNVNQENVSRKKQKRRVFIDESSNDAPDGNKAADSSSDEDIFEKLKKMSDKTEGEEESEGDKLPKSRRSKKRRVTSLDEMSNGDGEDLLAMAEEKLKIEKKKKRETKKLKKEEAKTKKGKEPKPKNVTVRKVNPSNFKSKEFISDSDDSSDNGESEKKLKDHYEQMLKKDMEELANKKALLTKSNKEEDSSEGSDMDLGKTKNSKSKIKDIASDESSLEAASDGEETNKENEMSNEGENSKKTKRNVLDSEDDED